MYNGSLVTLKGNRKLEMKKWENEMFYMVCVHINASCLAGSSISLVGVA